jgi:hypothetical protein
MGAKIKLLDKCAAKAACAAELREGSYSADAELRFYDKKAKRPSHVLLGNTWDGR